MNQLRLLIFFAFILSLTACNSTSSERDHDQTLSEASGKTLMAIFAHPDDESTVAPILARYVREGVRVVLVIATDGRLGVNDFSGLEAGESLVAIRKEEMKCAASQLGAELIHLEYHDQLKAAEGYDGHMPHAQSLILEIHDLIDEHKPDALITWGPDGGSNHMDHRLIGATVSSVYLSQQWDRPMPLYYYGSPASQIEEERSKKLRGVEDAYLTTHISYTDDDFEKAIKAISCHKSQFRMEGMRERMLARKRDNIVYLRKFVGPKLSSQTLFE